jgi:hypothetical protein
MMHTLPTQRILLHHSVLHSTRLGENPIQEFFICLILYGFWTKEQPYCEKIHILSRVVMYVWNNEHEIVEC